MWRDKRTGIYQTKVTGVQVSLKTKNSHVAGQREAKLRVDFGDAVFGLRKPSRIIVKELAEQYQKSLRDKYGDEKKFKHKLSRIRRRLEQHVFPEFAADAVMTIRTGRVQAWADRLAITHGADGVNRIVSVFRSVIKWGVRHDRLGIPFDPVGHWPRLKASQDKWTALTVAEVALVLGSQDQELLKIIPMVTMALFTGLRRENVILLRKDQADLDHGFIRIQGVETKGKDVITVPILPQVREILVQAAGNGSRFVFVKEDGRPWTPNSVSRIWRKALARIGIERPVRFHDLRHTFASHLAMRGKSLETIGVLLGHKDPKMTKRYAHLTPEYLQASVAGFGYGTGPCQPDVSGEKQTGQNQENEQNNKQ